MANSIMEFNLLILGESNAFSPNDDTDQDFAGNQSDLPANGVIQNANYFGNSNLWKPFELNINYSPTTPAWSIEYRLSKLILEYTKITTLNVLKYTRGSTRIGNSGQWATNPNGTMINGLFDIILPPANKEFKHVIFWQGLNDMTSDALADAYYDNLNKTINYLRANLGENTIIYIVKMGNNHVNSYTHRIHKGQLAEERVAMNHPLNKIVILGNSELNADGTHYSPNGTDDVAKQIFKEVKKYI